MAGQHLLQCALSDERAGIDLFLLGGRQTGQDNVEALVPHQPRQEARQNLLVLLHHNLDAVERGQGRFEPDVEHIERCRGIADGGVNDDAVEFVEIKRLRQAHGPGAAGPKVQEDDFMPAERLPRRDPLRNGANSVRVEIGDQQEPCVPLSERP